MDRRIHVVVKDGVRMRKIAILIDSNATIAELAQEISTTIGGVQVSCEIGDGWELRMKDSVMLIGEGEVVTARVLVPTPGSRTERTSARSSPPPYRLDDGWNTSPQIPIIPTSGDVGEPGRFQIQLVSAHLAHKHAVAHMKDLSLPSNGLYAFGGHFVSGNTSLSALRSEAARLFGWSPGNDMDQDESSCEHAQRGACSCATALEIEQKGLMSTLLCRQAINGSGCIDSACPYMHDGFNEINSTTCSICDGALTSACYRCLNATDSAVLYCPLTQNAGCGHVHHSHCIRNKGTETSLDCPSGCRRERFPQESMSFEMANPHVVLVWDGDRIDRLPVPTDSSSQSKLLRLSSTAILTMVEDFFTAQGYDLEGLSMRIHRRDPESETTMFYNSTLVSVCPTSAHTNQNHKRFDLFTSKILNVREVDADGIFSIDLHTAESPIIACGCRTLKEIFPNRDDKATSIVLYAVKRWVNPDGKNSLIPSPSRVSKESTFLSNWAWQPSIPQTKRAMSAFLSSLYMLARSIGQKGIPAEQKVLAAFHAITRFPPALRSLGRLFLNKTLESREQTPLAEAVYQSLKVFSSRGPPAIVNSDDRLFETARIFFAIFCEAADAQSTATSVRPLEEVPLICAYSRKLLKDPVMINDSLVERSTARLHLPDGELYHPRINTPPPHINELVAGNRILQILAQSPEAKAFALDVLRLDLLGEPPTTISWDLNSLGRDFVIAVRRANKTDLLTRGPLDLKSANVVPPQIVVDSDGFLTVFTGRGCGSVRDVNFFRPVNGGDTEVDVNDVAAALEKVIEVRKVEDTWQVDSFEGVETISHPPNEAIVICLDLSRSMKEPSAINGPDCDDSDDDDDDELDYEEECSIAVDSLLLDEEDANILMRAKDYITSQHWSCHHAWKSFIDANISRSRRHAAMELISQLGIMARRDAARFSWSGKETNSDVTARSPMMLACLWKAAETYLDALSDHLIFTVDKLKSTDNVNEESFGVPRNFIDLKTGDLLLDPVKVKGIMVSRQTKEWLDSMSTLPTGYLVPNYDSVQDFRNAVSRWASGSDILPVSAFGRFLSLDLVTITLEHEGSSTSWKLPTTTTTRKLYILANRFTHARYSSFTLRLAKTKAVINNLQNLQISLTDLVHGGTIEISRATPHKRKMIEFTVQGRTARARKQIILVHPEATALALKSYIRDRSLSELELWSGLKPSGDGFWIGERLDNEVALLRWRGNVLPVEVECHHWDWSSSGGFQSCQSKPVLTRLHLMDTLFNVFMDRVASFDTSVSLVLGLVTFSDNAKEVTALTPIIDNLRRTLKNVNANGDTAVYDALETARTMLVKYRPDLPNIRKRIIIVSDGDDTSSKSEPVDVCRALRKNGIKVDSVQVGTSHNPTLHAISVATGGYRFFPQTTLSDAMSIFDLETVLDSSERPSRSVPWSFSSLRPYQDLGRWPIDLISIDRFPQRAEHPKLRNSVLPAGKAPMTLSGDDRLRRIMREIQNFVADPHPQIDLYVNEEDISFLKVIIQAPQDAEECPYKGGCFLLTCDLPVGYPRDPPEIRFVTFILHPNVSKQGKVCVAELARLWASDITLKEVLGQIYGLLLEPDLDNPLEIHTSLKYYDDDGTYALAAAAAVAEHASKTREQWKKELSAEE